MVRTRVCDATEKKLICIPNELFLYVLKNGDASGNRTRNLRSGIFTASTMAPCGASGRFRDADKRLFRPLLYHLSYRGIYDASENPQMLRKWWAGKDSNLRCIQRSGFTVRRPRRWATDPYICIFARENVQYSYNHCRKKCNIRSTILQFGPYP